MTKVLIIGLDGATFDLIHPWVQAGHLPTLARLLAEGASGPLRSVPNMNSAPAWTSFATGKNPGKHGIFFFTEQVPGTYQRRYLNGGFRNGRTFWSLLGDSGVRVGIINVPMTFPAEQVNGFMLAGFDAPGVASEGFAHPGQLAREIVREAGEYIIEPGIPDFVKAGRRDLAVQSLLHTIDCRQKHTLNLMRRFEWDLLVTVFTETDSAQHFFWKDLDPGHPDHDPDEARRLGSPILDIYRRCDQALSAILDAVGTDTTVLIMSDHGAGYNQRGAEFLNPLLAELGLLQYSSDTASPRRPAISLGDWRRPVGWAYSQMDRWLAPEVKLWLVRRFPRLRARVEQAMTLQNINWAETRVYATGSTDDLFINLRGREPMGIVEPVTEYEALRDRLIHLLVQARDVGSGQPAVAEVLRREEAYHGPYVGRSPDLLIRWCTEHVLSGLCLPDGTTTAGYDIPSPFVNGGHRMNGILIVHGPDVAGRATIPSASIMDIAPTALHLFGLPIPGDMDGRVLTEAFTEECNRQHPVSYSDSSSRRDRSEPDYARDEARVIEERLRGLGYID